VPRGDPDPRAALPTVPPPATPFPFDEFLTEKQIYRRPDNQWYVSASRPWAEHDTWCLIGEEIRGQDTLVVEPDGTTRSLDGSTAAGFSVVALAPLERASLKICGVCHEYAFPKHLEVCDDPIGAYTDHRGG
jgi:hypothetical protein